MKLNAEQIKKALECCSLLYEDRDCTVCPKSTSKVCTVEVMRESLSLINSQEQRIGAQDMTISELRKRAEKAEHDADRYAQRIKELTEENERLRSVGLPDDETYIKLSDAKHAIMDYIGEQTVSKYASSAECKSARGGAEGAMNELDYITPAQVAPIADTVRKMQERLIAEIEQTPNANEHFIKAWKSKIDQIAKEML